MKVIVVSHYAPPENVPIPASIPRELAARGHDVHLVTAFPSYPRGRLFPGYRQQFGHVEQGDGYAITRVPTWISHTRNPLGRIASYLSFGIGALQATRLAKGADVVYVYATQMTASIAPLVWRVVGRTPYVLHVQDLWPESVTDSGMLPPVLRKVAAGAMTPWLRYSYRRASAVIAISQSMAEALIARGARAEAVYCVFNWSTFSVARSPRRRPPSRGQLRLTYAGTVGAMQGLDVVVRALAHLRDLKGLEVDVYGDGTSLDAVKAQARDLKVDSVRFHGSIPPEKLEGVYADTDFQLVTLKDLPVFRMTIPSKFQASLARATPVIATVHGELAAIVQAHDVGFVSPPENSRRLAQVIREAYAMPATTWNRMSRNARELYESSMSMKAGIDRIEEILTIASQERHGHD